MDRSSETKPGAIKWLAHPFYHTTEHLPKDDPRRSGTFSTEPSVLQLLGTSIQLPAVTPDESELALLNRHYPDAEPANPPWSDIKADLLVAGVSLTTIREVTSRDLIRMLDRVCKSKPASVGQETAKEPLLKMIERRGLTPIAYLCEAAWNLREWLREVITDDTLQPVLSSLLPSIRRQVELSLIDAELSQFVTTLPIGDKLTAANLVASLEGLQLPGGTRILIPPGQPLDEVQWRTLSRARAMRIAMQLYDESGEPMFDCNKDADLDMIEQMDHKTLAKLWNAIENFDPINEPGKYKSKEGIQSTTDSELAARMRELWTMGASFMSRALQTEAIQIDQELLELNWPAELPFLDWTSDGHLTFDYTEDGEIGYACKDGTCIPLNDPRLGRYREVAKYKLQSQFAEMAQTANDLHDRIIDPTNEEPIPRPILRANPALAAWLNGETSQYIPSITDYMVLLPAFIERRRRLRERGLTSGTIDGGPWSEPDTPSQWAKRFNVSWDTLKRRFEDGSIRHKKLSSKSYQVHVEDLPSRHKSA